MKETERLEILSEIEAAALHPYEAVDVLWVALAKIANQFPGDSEHRTPSPGLLWLHWVSCSGPRDTVILVAAKSALLSMNRPAPSG